jgi:hypothetical protein
MSATLAVGVLMLFPIMISVAIFVILSFGFGASWLFARPLIGWDLEVVVLGGHGGPWRCGKSIVWRIVISWLFVAVVDNSKGVQFKKAVKNSGRKEESIMISRYDKEKSEDQAK